jgi:hypothetical protein
MLGRRCIKLQKKVRRFEPQTQDSRNNWNSQIAASRTLIVGGIKSEIPIVYAAVYQFLAFKIHNEVQLQWVCLALLGRGLLETKIIPLVCLRSAASEWIDWNFPFYLIHRLPQRRILRKKQQLILKDSCPVTIYGDMMFESEINLA